jgi:hypothetical protein
MDSTTLQTSTRIVIAKALSANGEHSLRGSTARWRAEAQSMQVPITPHLLERPISLARLLRKALGSPAEGFLLAGQPESPQADHPDHLLWDFFRFLLV